MISIGGSLSDAEAIGDKYDTGTSVTVRYDPDDPSESVLEPRVPGLAIVFAFAGGIMLAGGLFIYTRAA